ncbi:MULTISPECIES: PH domain-containing protein [Bacillus]|uniref:PH domain-containing protein n=1 Tax=Bacillus TaxID=1386 RepID=UPI00073B5C3D|nr:MULTISPECIES: PH domain-containing protein [Bacillus]MBL3611507.1 PH domain-containing protein [Bacillus sp. RHFS18]KAF6545001.1 PH domain-containing protein [Bacillus sp. EKM206B]KAF6545154.1 PH domain-containing protein [Bacillus sp. EKM207B]KAF6554046.1 PH domain-containing protein [Bacillus sp. EKM203B]KSV97123.1 hypothetical protein AR441_15315 [Bacillus velezensis]
MMSEPKRLHPAAVILNLFHTIIETIKNIILPFFLVYIVNSNHFIRFYGGIALAVLLIWLITASVIEWRKFTYRIEDGEFRIEEGLFFTKKRYISIDRIQSMNTSAGIIQQLFKLVKLQIETAGDGKNAEAVLSAITVEEAERIRAAVFQQKAEQEERGETAAEQEPMRGEDVQSVYRLSVGELLMAASTSGGIGVIISAVFALFSQIDEVLPMDWLYDRFSFLKHASIGIYAVIIFIGLFIAWLLSIVGMMIKHANFKIEKKEHELVITRGIIEKHQVTIPLRKIQAIKMKENVIRQLFGYATVAIVSAGSAGNEKEGAQTILFPIIRKSKLGVMLNGFTPDYVLEENGNHLPKRALRRYLFRSIIFSVFVIIPLCILFKPWGYASLLVLPVELVLGYASFRTASWCINGGRLQITTRLVGKTTTIMLRRRMQMFEVSRSFLQKRRRLASVATAVKSAHHMEHVMLKDVSEEDAERIGRWYSYEKADG